MRVEEYPPQEPLSDFGRNYQTACFSGCEGIAGEEHFYGKVHASQSLMVYPAARPDGACLIFLHGGGWTNGYKELMAFLAPGLNAQGVTLVSVGYRLAPEYTFPANLDDAAAAVAWVYRNAARYKIDPKALFVGGHSAGAHLTALLAVRHDWQEKAGVPADVIRGCLPISGTYDFTPGNGLSMRPRFLGPEVGRNEVAASPLFNLRKPLVPFFLAMGSQDFPHLMMQTRKFAMVFAAAGGEAELVELEGADHITVVLEAAKPDGLWMKRAAAWMKRLRSAAAGTSPLA
jgi:arylformamidase